MLMTGIAVFLAVGPLIADLNASHVANPLWPGHARLHTVWLISTNALVAMIALGLLWGGTASVDKSRLAGVLLGAILLGFFIAGATRSLYGGAFTDPNGIAFQIGPFDANVAAFSLLGVLLIMAVRGLWSSDSG